MACNGSNSQPLCGAKATGGKQLEKKLSSKKEECAIDQDLCEKKKAFELKFVACHGKASDDEGNFISPFGVAIIGKTIAVADTDNERVQLVNISSEEDASKVMKQKSQWTVVELSFPPWAICPTNPDSHTFRVVGMSSQVVLLNQGDKILSKFSLKDRSEFGGICCCVSTSESKETEIYLTQTRQKSLLRVVESSSTSGVITVTKLRIQENGSDVPLKGPMQIAIHNRSLFVVDRDADRVLELGIGEKECLKLLRTFPDSTETKATAKLIQPRGVAVTDSLVIVADTANHRLVMFSREGGFLSEYGTKGKGKDDFYYPTAISISDGLVVVCDTMNSRIKLFRLIEK